MNPLVKKEIRLLLPSFVFACVLALPNFFFRFNPDGSLKDWWWFLLAYLFCGAATVMLALSSFGAEICSGTFSNLLSQPVARQKIWETKILLLALCLLIIGLFWGVCGLVRLKMLGRDLNLVDLFTGVGLFGLVMFSGGLWTVLLLRQVAAAFWFTVLVPGVLWAIVAAFFGDQTDDFVQGILVVVLGIYSLGGLLFARWLFLRAQDVAWSGGTIAMPDMRGLARFKLNAGTRRWWRPRAALQAKEFQLHQSQFVMAGVLALLNLGVIALRKFGGFQKNSSTEFVLESFWLLWMVMPMLVGCAAAAEERKLGTLESQLCLPVRRRTQFVTKAGIVSLLSLLFGVAMPLLLEGSRILPNAHFDLGSLAPAWQSQMFTAQVFFWNCLGMFNGWLPLFLMASIALMTGLISFFVSTLARNTLQALAPAVLGMLIAWFLIFTAANPRAVELNYGLHLPWRGWLFFLLGLPVMTLTLLALASGNFQRLQINGRVWLRNALRLVVTLMLVAVATAAIYHRVWEKLTPFEPPHGPARLSLINPAMMIEQWDTLSVRLPDGRVWTDDYALNTLRPNPLALMLGNLRLTSLGGGYFLDGSNWVSVTRVVFGQRVGIKTDGTLWISERFPRMRLVKGFWQSPKMPGMTQFGSATNWNSVVPIGGTEMLLVKNDETLWRWGVTNWNYKKRSLWPGFQTFQPQRLGTESDWAEVFQINYEPCLRKTDGSVWTTWINSETNQQIIKLEAGLRVGRAPVFEHGHWRSITTTRIGLECQLGIRDDGTFRLGADEKFSKSSKTYEMAATDLQFGTSTNWLAVAGRGGKVVTLKDDGTLWVWNFHHDYWRGWNPELDEQEMLATQPVRLGTHSDWIAIASTDGGAISLAADGSLWYWPLADAIYLAGNSINQSGDIHFTPLLDISHKPQLLANVFGKAN